MSYALPEPNIDIVLVELSQNLKYGRDISPICISKNVKPKVGDVAVVAGFGTLYIEYDPTGYAGVDSEANHLLHEGLVTVKDFTKCTNLTRENEETAICAGGINRGVMPGDSGGPIMGVKNNKFYLYGSVSGGRAFQAGDDNLTVNEFDAYTIVSSHCDWIEAVTKGDVKCEK
uniref:Peptidase S1 domain-containing protein n=1 Tax=Panagrolaimus superbus TaxID=310955 RepID=A0A914XXF4_9BILA